MSHLALEVRISVRRQEAHGICSLELMHCEGKPLPAFFAGVHIDVSLPNRLTNCLLDL